MKSLEMSPIFSFTSNCSQPKELASIGFIILVSSLLSGCLNSIILVVNIPLIFVKSYLQKTRKLVNDILEDVFDGEKKLKKARFSEPFCFSHT